MDENLPPQLAAILRSHGVDAVSVQEVNARSRPDEEQLERAVHEGRCMVTRDRDDFIQLTVQWFREGRPHFGLLIVPYTLPNDRLGAIARALVAYCQAHKDGVPPYTVDYLRAV